MQIIASETITIALVNPIDYSYYYIYIPQFLKGVQSYIHGTSLPLISHQPCKVGYTETQLCLGGEDNGWLGVTSMAGIGGVSSDVINLYPPLTSYTSGVPMGAILISPLV